MWREPLMAVLIGFAADSFAKWRRRRNANADLSDFESGLTVSFRAYLRELDAPRPAWRSGTLHLTPTRLTWSPRFARSHPITIDPTIAHAVQLRQPKGAESIRYGRELMIIVLTALGSRLELAIYLENLDLVNRIIPLPDHDLLPDHGAAPHPEEPNWQ